MNTQIGILGSNGKMGQTLCALLMEGASSGEFEITKRMGRSSHEPLSTMGQNADRLPDIWIDFSRPEATIELLDRIKAPIVIATTGFSDSQLDCIKQYSKKFPVVLAANTSMGVVLLKQLISSLGPLAGFDVVLTEEHHRDKVDAPSGTAKEISAVLSKHDIAHSPIQSTRAGGTFGVHTVKLVSAHESLEIKHTAFSRKVFAEGAIKAARFLKKLGNVPGLYSMEDVFGLNK